LVFERFDEQARQVVVLAQEEAGALKHDYIGTEHLLLGLATSSSPAADILASCGATPDAVRGEIVAVVGEGRAHPSGPVPFTPYAKMALELALRVCLEMRGDVLRSEHLLLGLLRGKEDIAVQVLVTLGVDLDFVAATARRSAGTARQAPGGPPGGSARTPAPRPSTALSLTRLERRLNTVATELASLRAEVRQLTTEVRRAIER
jgi:ATP-dependent Clp protease ATP-binding subunit ClpC